jgi:hypothetical protein
VIFRQPHINTILNVTRDWITVIIESRTPRGLRPPVIVKINSEARVASVPIVEIQNVISARVVPDHIQKNTHPVLVRGVDESDGED